MIQKNRSFYWQAVRFCLVKAMLEHAFAQGSSLDFILYWGAYQRKHFYLTDLPQQWQMQHTNFRFIPVLSDPIPEDAWEGRVGLVHEAVLADFPSLAGYEVYACGSRKWSKSRIKLLFKIMVWQKTIFTPMPFLCSPHAAERELRAVKRRS